jgi:hypothetical protein
LPQQTTNGAEVALIAGSLPGLGAPPTPPPDSYAQPAAGGDVLVATIKLAPGSSYTLVAHPGDAGAGGRTLHRNLYFYAGDGLRVGTTTLSAHAKIKVHPTAAIELSAPSGPAEVLVLQGRDIGEPVVQCAPRCARARSQFACSSQRTPRPLPSRRHGPFVGNTQQDVRGRRPRPRHATLPRTHRAQRLLAPHAIAPRTYTHTYTHTHTHTYTSGGA